MVDETSKTKRKRLPQSQRKHIRRLKEEARKAPTTPQPRRVLIEERVLSKIAVANR